MSSKHLVSVGLISYSAYLWHQPLLAFARHKYFDEISSLLLASLCLGSLLIAWLSWRYVEKPFRDKSKISTSQIFKFSFLTILILLIIGFLFQSNKIREYSPNYLNSINYTSLKEKIDLVGEVCDEKDIVRDKTTSFCILVQKMQKRSNLFWRFSSSITSVCIR